MGELALRVAAAEGEEKKKIDKDLTFRRANKELAYAKLVRINILIHAGFLSEDAIIFPHTQSCYSVM